MVAFLASDNTIFSPLESTYPQTFWNEHNQFYFVLHHNIHRVSSRYFSRLSPINLIHFMQCLSILLYPARLILFLECLWCSIMILLWPFWTFPSRVLVFSWYLRNSTLIYSVRYGYFRIVIFSSSSDFLKFDCTSCIFLFFPPSSYTRERGVLEAARFSFLARRAAAVSLRAQVG